MLLKIDLVYVLHAMNHSRSDDAIQHRYNHPFFRSNNFPMDDRWEEETEVVYQREFVMFLSSSSSSMMMMLYSMKDRN